MKLKYGHTVMDPATSKVGDVVQVGVHMVRVEFQDGTSGFYWTETDARFGTPMLCPMVEQLILTSWEGHQRERGHREVGQ
jgi:hypothetical protein